MSQNASTSSRTSTEFEAKVLPLRVEEEPSVPELERNAHRWSGITLSAVPLFAAVIVLVFAVWALLSPVEHDQSDSMSLVKNIEKWSVIGVLVGVALLMVYLSDMTNDKEILSKKFIRRGVTSARHTAKRLGPGLVPVLTKSHVDARIRTDDALRSKREEMKLRWDQGESDRIGALLFLDLNREPVIASLITDRGMIDAQEIEATLLEIESNTAAPVRSGWL